MGRAYEVRKVSIMKNGAAKSKLYSMYAREIYQAAKNGGTEIETNYALKRLVDRAKVEQVPADIIKRAIDKVNSGDTYNYDTVKYELFGPSGSTLIVDCLTDNVNRTISSVRTVVNKCHIKMGAIGSISYQYDNLAILSTKEISIDEALELMIENNIDIVDIESDEDLTIIYGNPSDLFAIKMALTSFKEDIILDEETISYLPKETITLEGEDKELFLKTIQLLDDIEDVNHIYHNVNLI